MESTTRTFRAPDPRAALDVVKAVMGPEAVIVSTKEVGRLFGPGEIEITATMPMQHDEASLLESSTPKES